MTAHTLKFHAFGPYRIPLQSGKRASYIPINCPEFWVKYPNFLDKKGCYVFAIRAAKGFRPIYVGMTKNTFGRECFTGHKIAQHYNPALMDKGKGTPVMFFVIPETNVGQPPKRIIKDLESFLIQVGVARNPELSNVRKKKEARWGIAGVIRGGKGRVTRDAREFKRAMGMTRP